MAPKKTEEEKAESKLLRIKKNGELFIKKANIVHKNSFCYDLVEYVNSSEKVKIKCKNNHIFEQTPSHHVSGNGCPKCVGKHRTFEEFKELSKNQHPEVLFDFSESLFVNMSTPIDIICPRKHTFSIPPDRHLKGNGGCILCRSIRNGELMKYSQEEWIKLAELKHPNLYTYKKVVYIDSQTPVIICCIEHGDFLQLPVTHLSGRGCPKCGINSSAQAKILTEEDFIDRKEYCNKIHNNKYKYGNIYRRNNYLYIEVICEIHDIFHQRLDHHMNGHGCCKCVAKYSKQQIEWLEYCQIRDGFIQHARNNGEYQIPETLMYADGFRIETNTIYEYQGDFWHGNPKIFSQTDVNPKTNTTYGSLFEKTKNKIEMLISKGYNVIEVWESDWERGKNAIINIQKRWRIAQSI